jgi:hypothetical protein
VPQTEAYLKDVIKCEIVDQINPLMPPSVTKDEIPTFIYCHNFQKALEKRDRTMERYNQRVSSQRQKVEELEAEISHLTREIKKRTDGSLIGNLMGKTLTSNKPGWFDNAEEHNKKAAKYNAILEVVRRLEDQRERVIYRRDDAVEKHNEAVEEAKEKLEELTTEALVVIDDDMVAVMDKTNKIALKLASSQSADDLLAAIEICYLQLKLSLVLEDHIEGNNQRREFKERLIEVAKLFGDMCGNEVVQNHMADLFHRNVQVIASNRQLNAKVQEVITSFDASSLDKPTYALRKLFATSFPTEFDYEHLIDPLELNQVALDIRTVIDNVQGHAATVKNTTELAGPAASHGVAAHQTVQTLLLELKSNHQRLAGDALSNEYFTCEMLNPIVIEDFYSRELKPAVEALKSNIAHRIGMGDLEALLTAQEDRYYIKRTETIIATANFLRLQAEIDKVDGYLKHISDLIDSAGRHIEQVNELPRKQAESFRSQAAPLNVLSCLPWLGIGFALVLLSKVKAFKAAFESSNEIYCELATDILQKAAATKKASLIFGGILGLGGMIVFLLVGPSMNTAVNVAVPGSALLLYVCTYAVFASMENLIREYQGHSLVSRSQVSAINEAG